MLKPFCVSAPTLTLAVTTSSVGAAGNLPNYASQVRIYNAGPNIARVQLGAGTLTATATDTPIPVGAVEVFTKNALTSIAAICETGTATLHITPGEGQ